MSNAILPVLAGLSWDITTSPQFNTKVHEAISGYEQRAAFMVYPKWTFKLKYELLRDNIANNEFKTLIGFFNARQGRFDSFLYANPADSAVVAMQFGVGTGAQYAFQLTRSYGGYTEPVQNLNGAIQTYLNGVLTASTVSATGVVTFASAPASGVLITWTGSFYYRCRFLNDAIDPSQFMKNLYSLSKLEFIGSPVNKV